MENPYVIRSLANNKLLAIVDLREILSVSVVTNCEGSIYISFKGQFEPKRYYVGKEAVEIAEKMVKKLEIPTLNNNLNIEKL